MRRWSGSGRALVIAALIGTGCAASRDRAPAARDPEPFAHLPILSDAPISGVHVERYGVNETIEVSERPISRLAVDTDRASYALVRSYLERGLLPEPGAVRTEEFINATTPPDPRQGVSLEVELFPHPFRDGFHVLRLALRAGSGGARPPSHFVFAMAGEQDAATRVVERAAAQLPKNDRMTVIASRARALPPADWIAVGSNALSPLLLRALEVPSVGIPKRVIVLLSGGDGVLPKETLDATENAARQGVPTMVFGFAGTPYADAAQKALAARGGGPYLYAEPLCDPGNSVFDAVAAAASHVTSEVRFVSKSVRRYRLLGYENRTLAVPRNAAVGGTLSPGRSATLLYEVELIDSPETIALAAMRYRDVDGVERTLERNVERSMVRPTLEAASREARISMAAAAFAEKLRGSYEAQDLGYDQLLALAELGEHRELREIVIEAARIDRGRADTSFDRVPVLQ